MPDAARISDLHTCPKVEPGPVPHVGGPIFTGSANVIIGYLPAARADDSVVCFPTGPTNSIKSGSTTVLINNRSAARRGDPCTHSGGSVIVRGCPTVLIGDSPQNLAFRLAAARGTPICEECARDEVLDDRPASAAFPARVDTDTATLDDPEPPPGAVAGRDLLARPDLSLQALARQPDQGDHRDSERRAARVAVAYQFYAAHAGARIKPSRICAHLRAIDISKPVEVIDVSGQTMYQHGVPGASDGQYFALDPDVRPESLGASSRVYALSDGKPTPPPVPRDKRAIEFGAAPAFGLKSTAAAVPDTWSMPASTTDLGEVVDCAGGATQVMIPTCFHGASSTAIR